MINKSLSQKGSVHVVIIVILIVALVGALGFVFWKNFINIDEAASNKTTAANPIKNQKKNRYSGWKVYNNYEDNYGIKYPSDWIFVDETASDGIYIRNFDPSSENSDSNEDHFTIRVIKIDGNDPIFQGDTAANWYDKLGKSPVSMGPVTYEPDTVKAIHLNNTPAKTTKAVFDEIHEDIFLLRIDTLYQFNLYPYGASNNETVKNILDSFFYTMDPKDARKYIQD